MLNLANMKKSITILLFSFCLISSLFSQTPLTPASKTNFITATISDPKGDIKFRATEILCRNKNIDSKKGFTLGGFTKERYFTINIPQNPAVGVYKIEGAFMNTYADYYIRVGQRLGFKTGKCEGVAGVLEITSIVGKQIKGKFYVTVSQYVMPCNEKTKRQISNGVFETTFTD